MKKLLLLGVVAAGLAFFGTTSTAEANHRGCGPVYGGYGYGAPYYGGYGGSGFVYSSPRFSVSVGNGYYGRGYGGYGWGRGYGGYGGYRGGYGHHHHYHGRRW